MLATKREPPVSLRDKDIEAALKERGDQPGQIAKRDLARYYGLLDQAMSELTFNEAELMYMLGLGNGFYWQVNSHLVFRDRLTHTLRAEGTLPGQEFDGEQLLDKVRGMTHTQILALIDAFERFWRAQATGGGVDEELRRLGLVRNPCFRHELPYEGAEGMTTQCPKCNRYITYVRIPAPNELGPTAGWRLAGIPSTSYLLAKFYEIRNSQGPAAAGRYIGYPVASAPA